jgi:mono/diheme cytochrome c family protein
VLEVRRVASLVLCTGLVALGGVSADAAGPWPGRAARPSPAIELVSPSERRTLTLDDLRRQLTSVTLTVDDPVYGARKTYQGFPLAAVLALTAPVGGEVDEVVFHTRDGYAPTLALARAREPGGLLAFRDVARRGGFAPIRQGKALLDPGPFYVVWAGAGDQPWPYQLTAIELVSFRRTYDRLYPAGAETGSAPRRGFLAFKTHCLRCHSVNLQGGALGPELNVPLNVTEYRDADTLRRFIRDAGAFRARSKMPPFSGLAETELDDLLAYLDYMKGRKRAE